MARERGIKIICDEIMCGLGRHGKGTLFISEAWDLDPDCVTVRYFLSLVNALKAPLHVDS